MCIAGASVHHRLSFADQIERPADADRAIGWRKFFRELNALSYRTCRVDTLWWEDARRFA